MSLFSFGEHNSELGYKVLDERVVRGSAGILLLIGAIASINGFILKDYAVLPWLSGFMVLNFAIGLFINPKLSPTIFISKLAVYKQNVLPIGAVQKKFAWSLGLAMSTAIFVMSIFLLSDASWFDSVCMLCLVCLLFLFLETAFGICVGCQTYYLALRLKLIPAPKVAPNCMGNSCEVP
jgi:hypothetical protein